VLISISHFGKEKDSPNFMNSRLNNDSL
jgi:hypothetical protein